MAPEQVAVLPGLAGVAESGGSGMWADTGDHYWSASLPLGSLEMEQLVSVDVVRMGYLSEMASKDCFVVAGPIPAPVLE